jgi:hypothetical protein
MMGDESRLGARKPRKLAGSLRAESIRGLWLGCVSGLGEGNPRDVVVYSMGECVDSDEGELDGSG